MAWLVVVVGGAGVAQDDDQIVGFEVEVVFVEHGEIDGEVRIHQLYVGYGTAVLRGGRGVDQCIRGGTRLLQPPGDLGPGFLEEKGTERGNVGFHVGERVRDPSWEIWNANIRFLHAQVRGMGSRESGEEPRGVFVFLVVWGRGGRRTGGRPVVEKKKGGGGGWGRDVNFSAASMNSKTSHPSRVRSRASAALEASI